MVRLFIPRSKYPLQVLLLLLFPQLVPTEIQPPFPAFLSLYYALHLRATLCSHTEVLLSKTLNNQYSLLISILRELVGSGFMKTPRRAIKPTSPLTPCKNIVLTSGRSRLSRGTHLQHLHEDLMVPCTPTHQAHNLRKTQDSPRLLHT